MHTHDLAPVARVLRTWLTLGVIAVLLVPAARGNTMLGFLPLWLVAMPASALWAMHRFALPRLAAPVRRRRMPQAYRRT